MNEYFFFLNYKDFKLV